MKKTFVLITLVLFLLSCNKTKFLDEKPRTSLLVPTTLRDFEMLMDNTDMTYSTFLGEVSSDDIYLANDNSWTSLTYVPEKYAYIWAKDIYQGQNSIRDWNQPYAQILIANIVIERLEKHKDEATVDEYNRIKGWAHFIRGNSYFNLAQLFAAPYNETTSESDLGVQIRRESDVTLNPPRSTLEETYREIIINLEEAEKLLPSKSPGVDRNRPYKYAAQGLLARVYLNMRNYDKALEYSNKVLNSYDKLMDYNLLDKSAVSPFSDLNEEILYMYNLTRGGSNIIGTYRVAPNTLINENLYLSYEPGDLRKDLFYTISSSFQKPVYKGSYSARTTAYGGVATDELYLIKAECQVRNGSVNNGMETLNKLLATRWNPEFFKPIILAENDNPLDIVLKERRKELIFRGIRWQDLRRLNIEGAGIDISRTINGRDYSLAPNSPLYILPIPSDETTLSGIEQNVR